MLEAVQQGDIIILFALKYFYYSPAQIENITHKYQSIAGNIESRLGNLKFVFTKYIQLAENGRRGRGKKRKTSGQSGNDRDKYVYINNHQLCKKMISAIQYVIIKKHKLLKMLHC